MGDRGNVLLKYSDGSEIYFYTHWSGSNLIETVRNALIRGKSRWDDEQYLARIIFCEMIQDDVLGITGYGISTSIGDGAVKVVINFKKRTANDESFEEFIGE